MTDDDRNPVLRILDRGDRMQRRHASAAFVIGVFKKFGEDRAGRLAALIAYYSFFSVFPLLLVLVTTLGFVFGDDATVREEIAGSALAQIPVVGNSLQTGSLEGNGIGLAVGIVGALWAGLGAMLAGQDAMNAVWDVPIRERPNPLYSRVRALLMLGVLGMQLIGATVLSAIGPELPGLNGIAQIGIALGTIALNTFVVGLAFQVLTDRRLSVAQIWPGAVFAGVGYYVLQTLGTRLVAQRISTAGEVYGTFASVIGLLTYFYLLAQVTVLAAVVNVVRDRRLYPRSLLGDDHTEADRRAQLAYAREAKRSDAINIEIRPSAHAER